jgi:hypothetical protein
VASISFQTVVDFSGSFFHTPVHYVAFKCVRTFIYVEEVFCSIPVLIDGSQCNNNIFSYSWFLDIYNQTRHFKSPYTYGCE